MSRVEIRPTLTQIAEPQIEPLDLDQCKKKLRVSTTSEDTIVDGDISAARQYFEVQTSRKVMAQTLELWASAFPSQEIELPYPPLLSVESVSYIDADGVDQSLIEDVDYKVIAPRGVYAAPGWVECAYGKRWPSARLEGKSIRVRYIAGYGYAPGDVPEYLRQMLYLLVGDYYKYRTNTVETTFKTAFSELPLGTSNGIRDFAHTAKLVKPLWVDSWV